MKEIAALSGKANALLDNMKTAVACVLAIISAIAAPNAAWADSDRQIGDVNGNGTVNIVDAQVAYDMCAHRLYTDRADYPNMWKAADINKDDWVDALDAFAIQVFVQTGNLPQTENESYQPGDTISLGSYEQDNDISNGKEPIEWTVLAINDDNALLCSKYSLDAKKYNDSSVAVTWETCTLRSWLNNAFYNNAFLPQNRELIQTTYLINTDDHYMTSGGNPTYDKIFCSHVRIATHISVITTEAAKQPTTQKGNIPMNSQTGSFETRVMFPVINS